MAKPLLKMGSNGPEVSELQKALRAQGLLIPVTGEFDARTKTMVMEFQKQRGLQADGIVGAKTWEALSKSQPKSGVYTCGNVQVDLRTVLQMCPESPAPNVERYLPLILQNLEKRGMASERMIRLAIATVYTETRSFVPLSEFKSKYNTSEGGKPFDLYDNRRDLGNQGAPDGERFRGRGLIQLTGRENYLKYGAALNVDLVGNPDLANSPEVAAAVLAEYLKKREAQFSQALATNDLAKARKLVNGGSHGLDVFTAAYQAWDRRSA